MANSNFKEGHPNVPWKPNLFGHQQKRLGHCEMAIRNLEERTNAIRDDILKKKIKKESEDIPHDL